MYKKLHFHSNLSAKVYPPKNNKNPIPMFPLELSKSTSGKKRHAGQ